MQVVDSPDHSDGTMLALFLPLALAAELAVPGGLPTTEMHVTVAYTGHTDEVDPDALLAAALDVIRRPALNAVVSGHARFTGTGDGDALVALVDSPALERLRRDVVDALTAHEVALPSDHGYCAHTTLAYLDPDEPSPVDRIPPHPVRFPTLSVVHGTTRTDLPFTPLDTVEAVARDAYQQGWAATGGPMTERVRAGCTAAVAMAVAEPDRPGVLEATLHLGRLEGVWARVFERRDRLHAAARRAVADLWLPMAASVDWAAVAATAQHLTEADAARTALVARLVDLILGRLRALTRNTSWPALRQAVRDAIASAWAEGQADALALAAEHHAVVGYQFEVAFDDALHALEHSDRLWADADRWLAELVADTGKQVGRVLADLIRQGAGADEMTAAVADLLGTTDEAAVAYVVDAATGRALSDGALALYGREGVEKVEFVTAGDSRVDDTCEMAEEEGPYLLADAPIPPLHPGCRCCLDAVDPLPLNLLTPYLGGE